MNSLTTTFFTQNREKIMEKLAGGLLVVSAYTQMQRGNDAAFKFEQEANFWYLTGIEHPDWWVIIDGARGKSWLVAPEVDDVHAVFDGSLDDEEARAISGIKEVMDQRSGVEFLKQAARAHPLVYTIGHPAYSDRFDFTLNPAPKQLHERLSRMFTTVEDFRGKLAEIRAIKQPEEIDAMQAAIDLTVKGFQHVYTHLSKYRHEYQIEADFTQMFRYAGASGHAYDPIVASGSSACTLHYSQNNNALKKGSLLLMDIGARHHGYAADITRTYAYGKPTKRQQSVHATVQAAQTEIISLLEPGLSVETYQTKVDAIMKRALMDLKLITDEKDEKYHKYFPHAISHGLGIDVHDALGKPRVLQPGMVLTVEPGIYIPEAGIGVRIEDDIVITDTGHRNMSGKLSAYL